MCVPTQYTSSMGKSKGEARGKTGTKGKSPKLDLTRAKDLTIELSEGHVPLP